MIRATGYFPDVSKSLGRWLAEKGQVVDVGEWQSIKDDKMPQAKTIELQNVVFEMPIPPTMEELQNEVGPNLPFAEAQFQDRVSGRPLNPPPSDQLWPWAHHLGDDKREGIYSHTYPERFWPKQAGDVFVGDRDMAAESKVNVGLRYPYGDLADVVSQLSKSPYTRQAYLPVFFPEDTGAVHGERVPCTLGYHFLLREGRLHCTYFIRSCDFFRHFADDVYMAARLCQWVALELEGLHFDRRLDWDAGHLAPGNLTMHIISLHVFEAERKRLERMG